MQKKKKSVFEDLLTDPSPLNIQSLPPATSRCPGTTSLMNLASKRKSPHAEDRSPTASLHPFASAMPKQNNSTHKNGFIFFSSPVFIIVNTL